MPQMTKGGKYIFGWSNIGQNGELTFPTMAVKEYNLQEETYIYIVSGSKQTGGFCVMTEPLLSHSKLKNIIRRKSQFSKEKFERGRVDYLQRKKIRLACTK